MKQKDIALIIMIVFIGGIISFFVSGKIFSTPAKKDQQVEVVNAINSDFQRPDSRYFNNTSYNPTKLITISDQNNQDPFNSAQ